MQSLATSDRATTFNELFSDYAGPPFALRLWDDASWGQPPIATPQCTFILRSPQTLQSLLLHPSEMKLGEAYLSGDLDVEGDFFAAFDVAQYLFQRPRGRRVKALETLGRLTLSFLDRLERGPAHSVYRDRSAIAHHYDLPVAFFEPWLGRSLVYSCAYFERPDDDLDTAQCNKLEHICRKLRLAPDDHFLDIGCGWGSLVLHAAAHHRVYAQGLTISEEQARVGEGRILAEAMTQSCRVDLLDYRLAPSQFAPFDKIASVGMFEHVGVEHLPEYFRTVRSMLKPGGVFLNHGIARAPLSSDNGDTGWLDRMALHVPLLRRAHASSFIDKYVFPDGELATLSETITAAENAGFEVRDVENLREHYELTLRAWVDRLQRCRAQIAEQYGETACRIWLLYMAGSAAAFHRGELAIYQVLLHKPAGDRHVFPLTRRDGYQARAEEGPARSLSAPEAA